MEKTKFFDRLTDFILEKIAPPMAKFSALRPMRVIRGGLVSTLPIVLVSSVFMILYILSSPLIGTSGKAALPFLEPFASKFLLVNNYGLGFLTIYLMIGLAFEYAKVYEVPATSIAVMALGTFLAMNINEIAEGKVAVGNFSASGMLSGFIALFWAGYVLRWCLKKNIVIKMPEVVPPQIGASFTAIIPTLVAMTVAWVVKTILNLDINDILKALLAPVFKGMDSIVGYPLYNFLKLTFWSVGVHGGNMLSPIISPLTNMWLGENVAAMQAGVPLNELPHIFLGNFDRCVTWTCCVWGLLPWLFTSKVKSHRVIAATSFPSAIFTIAEPLLFGLPIVLNPIMMIPMVLSGTLSSIIGYAISASGLINRFFISLPWATPTPIIAFVGTGGDWKAIILVVQAFLVGVIVYYPFFKALEKQDLAEEKRRAAEIEAANT